MARTQNRQVNFQQDYQNNSQSNNRGGPTNTTAARNLNFGTLENDEWTDEDDSEELYDVLIGEKRKSESLKEEAIKKRRAAAALRKPTPSKDTVMDEPKITKVICEPRIPPRITILEGMKPYSVVEQL